MAQVKDPAAALEATVSGLRDGLLRSYALRGKVSGALRVPGSHAPRGDCLGRSGALLERRFAGKALTDRGMYGL